VLTRLLALFRRDQVHREIAEEREFHIATRVDELVRAGIPESQARAEAERSFGAPARMHEAAYDVRGAGILEDLAGDLRVSLRVLRKSPAKTAALVTTLAVGIGMNTAVFSIVKNTVLDPLPFAGPGALVSIRQVSKAVLSGVSYPNFEDWRARSRSFDGMSVYAATSATLTVGDEAKRLNGAVVSADLFRMLAVTPVRGRLFQPEEDAPGSEPTVLIADTLWRRQFHGEDVVGRMLTLDGVAHRIVGIIPAAQAFPLKTDAVTYWTTVSVDAEPSPWGGSVRASRSYPRYEAALARLKPGVTIAQAQAEMSAVATNVARQHPTMDTKDGVRVGAAIDEVVGSTKPLWWTLYGAVFCVLAVGCANAATLLLVGALARAREFALRTALGAKPARIVRQLLVESLVLALGAGFGGALLAWGLLELFLRIAPPDTPRLAAVHAEPAMLIYALLLSLITGLLFGLAPAVATLRHNLQGVLRDRVQSAGRGHGRLRPGTVLIAGQIALSMMLACSATLLTASFWRILHIPRGFESHQVLTASLSLPPTAGRRDLPRIARFYRELMAKMRLVPGVEAVGATQSLPLSGQNNSTVVEIAGEPERKRSADLRFIDSEYFRTLKIPLMAGRFFTAEDRPGRPEVVVVNQAFEERFLAGRAPLDARLKLGWGGDEEKEIVGIVGDIRHYALGETAMPEVYVPMPQFPVGDMALVMRFRGELSPIALALRAQVREQDARVPVENVRTLEEYLLISAAPQRFLMWVLVILACSTLVLSAIGLYGAMSYSTACRRHEFGVRMALGAEPRSVLRLVIREGLSIATVGLTLGLFLSIGAARLLSGWLYGASSVDRLSLAIAGAVLMAAASAACWGPARLATKVDPVIALRAE
jgi:predicted permease